MKYGWRFVTLYRRQRSRPSSRKRNAKGQNGCLRSPYKYLWKENKWKAKEKRKYIHLNAKFQRITWRDKKVFLNDQFKEIEETNRMGKTIYLFKKIKDTKEGNISWKDGLNKWQKWWDLTEAEDIKKRWQEYTEELYKKDLHDQHNHEGVITHLDPDILECKVKWASGSITMNNVSGSDGIPVELF